MPQATQLDRCSIDDVVHFLSGGSRRGRRATVLIGAGCSVSAGVPLASGFVKRIRRSYPHIYEQSSEKTYASLMSAIGQTESRELVTQSLREAKLNYAHIALATLIKSGVVDRVLTTNFDRLLSFACALLGSFPSVYDLQMSRELLDEEMGRISYPAIFHLHGQETAFRLLHETGELEEQSRRVKTLVHERAADRTWIVVGYSGENDPVLKLLGEVRDFGSRLFWVGFEDNPLSGEVSEQLRRPKTGVFWLPGYNADRFFISLATRIGCWPPEYLCRPFTFLEKTLSVHADAPLWSIPTVDASAGPLVSRLLEGAASHAMLETDDPVSALVLPQIREAAEMYETHAKVAYVTSKYSFRAMDFGRVMEIQSKLPEAEQDRALLCSSHFMRAHALFDEAIQMDLVARSRPSLKRVVYHCKESLRYLDSAQAPQYWQVAMAYAASAHMELALGYQRKAQKRQHSAEARRIMVEYVRAYPDHLPGRLLAVEVLFCELASASECERRGILDLLYDHGAAALKLNDGKSNPYRAMALICIELSLITSCEAAKRYLCQAKSFAEEAEAIEPGSTAYILACIASLAGEYDSCRDWLRLSAVGAQPPAREHVAADDYLASVKDQEWFDGAVRAFPSKGGQEP